MNEICDSLSSNELEQIWKVFVDCATLIILFLTAWFAHRIGRKQNEINENLLNLNFIPSIDLRFDHTISSFIITNRGSVPIWLMGNELVGINLSILKEGRFISQASEFTIPAPNLITTLESIIKNRDLLVGAQEYNLFIQSYNNKKYQIKTKLLIEIRDLKIQSIKIQILGPTEVNDFTKV